MTSTVVPTRSTGLLASAMIATARREGSGAEAVILHLDDVAPEQMAALVGLLLDAASCAVACRECLQWRPICAKGMCSTCYQRETPPRRRHITCAGCGETRTAKTKDRCARCYQRARRMLLKAAQVADEGAVVALERAG